MVSNVYNLFFFLIDLGDRSLQKLELSLKKSSTGDQQVAIQREIDRLEREVEVYKGEVRKSYEAKFDEEKKLMKEVG